MTETIKFDHHEELLELQAKIYLETKVKLSKKELLGIVFQVGLKKYQDIVEEVIAMISQEKQISMKEILELAVDLGEGSESLSESVDSTIYKR